MGLTIFINFKPYFYEEFQNAFILVGPAPEHVPRILVIPEHLRTTPESITKHIGQIMDYALGIAKGGS